MGLDVRKMKLLAIGKCWSLAELQRRAGLANGTLYQITNGKNNASGKTIGKIARALSVEPSEIIKE